jgi:hypothetical protein
VNGHIANRYQLFLESAVEVPLALTRIHARVARGAHRSRGTALPCVAVVSANDPGSCFGERHL